MKLLLFWTLLALMTLLAAAFILWPLMRRAVTTRISRRAVNIEIYQQRLCEIDDSLARGEAGEAETATARADAERALICDVEAETNTEDANAAVVSQRPRLWPWLTAILLILPAAAVGFYLWNADWRLALAPDGPAVMEILLTRLETHLRQEPADANGWQLLAQSRARLGQQAQAANAYARLNALSVTADGLVGEAEALGQLAGGSLQGRPMQLLMQSLRLDPDHPRALWYAGLAALQHGNNLEALRHLNKLAEQELPHEFRRLLEIQILAAGGKLTPKSQHKKTEILLEISLAPEFSAAVSADMPVFIYARDAQTGQKGPPLAALRQRVADLPITLRLGDEHSMLPSRKLSSVDAWSITARIARQGSAESRSGDLYAESQLRRADLSQTTRLRIDQKVP